MTFMKINIIILWKKSVSALAETKCEKKLHNLTMLQLFFSLNKKGTWDFLVLGVVMGINKLSSYSYHRKQT